MRFIRDASPMVGLSTMAGERARTGGYGPLLGRPLASMPWSVHFFQFSKLQAEDLVSNGFADPIQ